MIKRLICVFRGHKWGDIHDEYYPILKHYRECERCGKRVSGGKVFPLKPWPPPPEKEV